MENSHSENQARLNALRIVRRQTTDIAMEHIESYFRALAMSPDKPLQAFAAMDAITETEKEYMKRTFCADCECFQDILAVRKSQLIEAAALEAELEGGNYDDAGN